MSITPFKYVLNAHVFAFKNYENVIRLCIPAGFINTVFFVFIFGYIEGKSIQSVAATLYIGVIAIYIINLLLSVMLIVPYIQYAYEKHQDPTTHIRPIIQMAMTWNTYKTAYLITTLKILFVSIAVLGGTLFVLAFLNVPSILINISILFLIPLLWRLHIALSASALGEKSNLIHIWKIGKGYTLDFLVLLISFILFFIPWALGIFILSAPFFLLNMMWANAIGFFIQMMLSYTMALILAHSLMLLYIAIRK